MELLPLLPGVQSELANFMKTTNAIEWFYDQCRLRNESYGPLFELLFRLWRAREINFEKAPDLPRDLAMLSPPGTGIVANVCDFAIQFYHDGHPDFGKIGGRIRLEESSAAFTHSRNGGGLLKLNKVLLSEAWHRLQTNNAHLRSRIDEMDQAPTKLLALAAAIMQKMRSVPLSDIVGGSSLHEKVARIIKNAEKAIAELDQTQK
jgi:hypothetical protein